MNQKSLKKSTLKRVYVLTIITADIFLYNIANAQTADGNNGISQANTMVRGYFDTATQLMYGVGAILGLIGAIRVYSLYGSHSGEASKAAASWFGACIFLVVVSTVLRSFFGL